MFSPHIYVYSFAGLRRRRRGRLLWAGKVLLFPLPFPFFLFHFFFFILNIFYASFVEFLLMILHCRAELLLFFDMSEEWFEWFFSTFHATSWRNLKWMTNNFWKLSFNICEKMSTFWSNFKFPIEKVWIFTFYWWKGLKSITHHDDKK